MTSSERRFWSKSRRRRLAIALLLGLCAAAIASLLSDRDSVLRRGDFPACYSAGVLASLGSAVYDQAAQLELQNRYWPELHGKFLYFPYPPYVAVMCGGLSLLSPFAAKMIFTAAMLFFALAALHIAGKLYPHFRENAFFNAVIFVSFGPLLSSIAAAQYTAISLLLFTAALYFVAQKSRRGEIFAGLVLGLWFFKPHYALTAVALICCAGRWRIAAAAVCAGLVLTISGGIILGWQSYLHWLNGLGYFAEDLQANAHQMVSISGFYSAIAAWTGGSPAQASRLSLILSCLVGGLMAVRFWRGRNKFEERFMEISAAVLLVSPHTLYYDLGLLAAWGARDIRLRSDRSVTIYLLLWTLFFIITLEKQIFPVSPLFVLPVVALLYSVFTSVQQQRQGA